MKTGEPIIPCLFLSVLFLGACRDDHKGPRLVETQTSTELRVPSNGAYGILLAGAYRAGAQDVTLRIGSEQFDLSSYQGSLHFDTAKMHLVNIVVPESDFHLVNRLDAESGTLRFAGFALDGFPNAVDVRFSFESQVPIRSGDITFALEILGTPAGSEIRREEVLAIQEVVQEEVR